MTSGSGGHCSTLVSHGNVPEQTLRDSNRIYCPICLERYTRKTRAPISLNCGHTFCSACVARLNSVTDDVGRPQHRSPYAIICGTCRAMTYSTKDRMKKNVLLFEILREMNQVDESEEEVEQEEREVAEPFSRQPTTSNAILNHEQLEVENTSLIQHGVLAHLWNKFCEAEALLAEIRGGERSNFTPGIAFRVSSLRIEIAALERSTNNLNRDYLNIVDALNHSIGMMNSLIINRATVSNQYSFSVSAIDQLHQQMHHGWNPNQIQESIGSLVDEIEIRNHMRLRHNMEHLVMSLQPQSRSSLTNEQEQRAENLIDTHFETMEEALSPSIHFPPPSSFFGDESENQDEQIMIPRERIATQDTNSEIFIRRDDGNRDNGNIHEDEDFFDDIFDDARSVLWNFPFSASGNDSRVTPIQVIEVENIINLDESEDQGNALMGEEPDSPLSITLSTGVQNDQGSVASNSNGLSPDLLEVESIFRHPSQYGINNLSIQPQSQPIHRFDENDNDCYIADLIDFNNDDMLVSSNAFQFPDSSALTPTPFRWNGTARRGRDGLFGDLLGSFFVSSPNFIECRLPNSPHTQMHNRNEAPIEMTTHSSNGNGNPDNTDLINYYVTRAPNAASNLSQNFQNVEVLQNERPRDRRPPVVTSHGHWHFFHVDANNSGTSTKISVPATTAIAGDQNQNELSQHGTTDSRFTTQLPSPQQQIDCVEEIFRDGSRRFVETGRNNTINNAIDLFLSSIAESAAPFENLTDLTDDDLRNLDDGFYIQESFCDENNSQRGVSDDLIDLNF